MKKNIYIGNQTACTALTLMDPFDYAVRNSFDAFEWFIDKKENGAGWDERDLSLSMRREIRERARGHNIRLSVHAPCEFNPVLDNSNSQFHTALDLADELGAVLMNVHLFVEDGLNRYVDALYPIIKRSKEMGIRLSIENTPKTTPEDFNNLFSILRTIPEASMSGMCLDIGHANLCYTSINNYIQYIDWLDMKTPIIHIHIHENYGDYDAHLPIFSGPAGKDPSGIRIFLGKLKERGYSGSFIMEQWPGEDNILRDARERLMEMTG